MAFLEMRVPQPFTNRSGLLEVPNTGGAVIDLNADTITATNGEAVTSWASTGTNPLTLNQKWGTGISFPILRQDAVNGHNAVDFLGSHSIFSESELILPAGQPSTYAMVVKMRTSGRILSGYPADSNYRTVTHRGTDIRIASQEVGEAVSANVIPVDTPAAWHVLIARWSADGNLTLMTSEGKQLTSPSSAGQALGVIIGSTSSGATPLDGQVARLSMWDRALTDLDCQSLMAKLRSEYAIKGGE